VRDQAQSADRLATRIMWGLVVGLLVGVAGRWLGRAWPVCAGPAAWVANEVLDPVGQVFLRMLFFVVVPLVFSSLALGIAQLGRLERLGPLAGRTFLLFALNMSIGVALGLLIMNTVKPGGRMEPDAKAQLLQQFSAQAQETRERTAREPRLSLSQAVEMFLPRNLLKAVVEFQLLPLILFGLLVGAAGTQLPPAQRMKTQEALGIVADLMTRIVHYAMRFAPVAVAALMCSLMIKVGVDVVKTVFLFVVCILAGILVHLFGTMPLLLRLLSRRRPLEFFRAIRSILVTAFSTSSSNATLPTSIEVSREQLGVSAPTVGFVLPLGATMNMSGTALYEGCVVLFVAQVYGVPLSLASQVILLLLAVLSAVAVAGIPGASLPLIVGLLANFNLPAEGIALILGVDRVLDMARTVLNVAADVVTACIVDEQLGPPQAST
jgi:DAACS family dicarboxylate/amino acid:cation (Na+ or H+) symporter